ncbi:obtusifoliol 14-alpha demethylase-like [Miscanthus floridulus]|uniref:obtusifoliol 14-alpha demethylase-like n=1 Tax=Miscanthus floridulus TaxID=154761 RepID=UPI00345A6377
MDLTTIHVAACLTIALLFLITTKMIILQRKNLNKKGPALPPVVSVASLIALLPTLLTRGLPTVIHGLHAKLGTVFTISLFGVKKVTFLVGPEATAHFFHGSESEIRQSNIYEFSVPVVGRGVMYDVDLTTRSRQISFCTDAIKSMNLRSHVDAVVQEVEDYFAQWGQHGVVDLKHEIWHLILAIANRCLLGKHIRDNMFDQVATLLNELFDNTSSMISFFFPYLPIPQHRRRDKARSKLGEIIHEVVRTRRSSGLAENDVLQRLVDSNYINGRPLTESEIAGLLVGMVFAGQHTTSSAGIWTGACLLSDGGRDHLAAAVEEQREIVGRHGERLDYDILEEMVTLHCCIKEALRLHPPAMMLFRHASKGFNVRSTEGDVYGIPKGHTLVTCMAVSNTLPYIYKDPHVYDPSRFGPEREEDKVGGSKFSYMSFGTGRHACHGKDYAYMQIKAIWSHLLRNFDLELVSPFPEEAWEKLVPEPRGKVMVSYRRRVCSA